MLKFGEETAKIGEAKILHDQKDHQFPNRVTSHSSDQKGFWPRLNIIVKNILRNNPEKA